MQDIRLMCIDIDGTLLDSHHQLPSENRAAVCWAVNHGAAVCLMTARPPGATLPIQKALGADGPLACFGGRLVEWNGERLCDCRIPARTAALLVQECAVRRIHLSVYRDTHWYVAREDAWSLQEMEITGLSPTCAELENLVGSWERWGAHKLLCMGEPEQLDSLFSALEKRDLSIQLLRSKDTYLEIIPEGAGKAEAMEILCRKMGISTEQVLAIGDHDVDASLLYAAGFGVAMGNASPAAERAARHHTDTNDNMGVAKAIYDCFSGNL